MSRAKAFAKINLALVVGPLRPDGKHEVASVLQRIDLHDVLELEAAPGKGIVVEGFPEDTLVRAALEELADALSIDPSWHVWIEKRIPLAAGLGGGSSDAAAALGLANSLVPKPLDVSELDTIAAGIGADVPFFLREGPQLGTGDGSDLSPVELPQDYAVLLVVPDGYAKGSTAAVYRSYDERGVYGGFEERRAALLDELSRVQEPSDLASLPRNDLVSSPLAGELERLGAFRADVSGAGPAVYGLFDRREDAERAAPALRGAGRTWLSRPVPGG
jgi:4-diphosphocytidyl-2-C-methyl-D-erythritol kinase